MLYKKVPLFLYVLFRARVFNNMQTGQGAAVELKSEQILALKAGGHSVQELTGSLI